MTSKALLLLDHLFRNPVVHIRKIGEVCELSFKAANNLVVEVDNAGILQEMTGQGRNMVFMLRNYVDL